MEAPILLQARRGAPVSGASRLDSLLASDFCRYLIVSAVALGADWGLLIALTRWAGLPYWASGAIGFCAGLCLVYALSVAFVFRARALANPLAEFALFCLIGLIGLGVNEAALYVAVSRFGVSYALAKGPAAGLVFVFNFVMRKTLLFSRPAAARPAAQAPGGRARKPKPATRQGRPRAIAVPGRPIQVYEATAASALTSDAASEKQSSGD